MRTASLSTKETLVGFNKVFMFNAESGMSRQDPSNIKRFVTTMDGAWFVYEQQVNAKLWDITVAHMSHLAITSNLGIAVLDVA